tara:strand:+ start:2503 stop:3621 length:1119 start_codon:yes stop_codon:yes gene_type:complete
MIKTKKNLVLFMPFIGFGGVEKNLFILTNYFCKKFDNVTICTISNKFKKKFNKRVKFIIPKKKWPEKINIRLKYIICLFSLLKFLIKNKNSVVLSFQANIYCIVLCKFLNIKIIIRNNTSPSGWGHNFLKNNIYKFFVSLADVVIVNSLTFKKEMEKKFKIKVNCIFNPLNRKEIISLSKKKINENFFKSKKNVLNIINIGRLTKQKDHLTLLKAASILKNKIKFRLLILGNGTEEEHLNNYIKLNNLSRNVKIRGFVNNPYPLLLKADIFVLSSKFEGLPNSLLESVVLKKLSISSNCPTGPKEILSNGNGGLLFKIGNYKELSKKILISIKNEKIMKKKILYAFKKLDRYDYNRNLNKYFLLVKPFLVTT